MNDLIVPIHDRRRHKRILTLKNFGRFAIAVAIVFAGLTLQSEFRRGPATGYYGRLFGKQVTRQDEIAKPKFDVIKEAPVSDQTAADPLLLEPAAREQQYLTPEPTTTTVAAVPAPAPVTAQSIPPVRTGTSGVTIVGGSEGVAIVNNGERKQPVLQGGIFKP